MGTEYKDFHFELYFTLAYFPPHLLNKNFLAKCILYHRRLTLWLPNEILDICNFVGESHGGLLNFAEKDEHLSNHFRF